MRKLGLVMAGILLGGILFYSCEKTTLEPAEAAAPVSQLTQFHDIAVTDFFNQRAEKLHTPGINENNGATFIEPFFTGEYFGVFDPSNFSIAGFGADYDDNDFWRENPDGSVTVHLTSRDATGEYFELFTGVSYIGGGGHMNLRYSGFIVRDTIVLGPNVGDTIYLQFLGLDPGLNALAFNGHGEVANEADPDDVKDLRVRVIDNPGGGGTVSVTLD